VAISALPDARQRFDAYHDLISGLVHNEMDYPEFAARVRRRRQGSNEDHDWGDDEPSSPDDTEDYDSDDDEPSSPSAKFRRKRMQRAVEG
jgi:hypothetical protein